MRRQLISIFLGIVLFGILSVTTAQYYQSNQAQGAYGTPPGKDAVHITQIQTLTLRDKSYTTHRRVPPVPQLTCVGGEAYRDKYRPTAVQCYNKGSDGNSIQWKCEADMDDRYQFGKLNVVCEGYRYSGDEWVLKGSCGLEYELDYTSKGANQRRSHYNHNRYQQNYNTVPTYTHDETSTGSYIVAIIVIVMIIVLIFRYCLSDATNTTTNTYRPTSTTRTSNIYPDANVPPYNPDYMQDQPNYGKDMHYASTSDSRPGFWTGAALGAATGFGLGRATAPSTHTTSYQSQSSYRSSTYTRHDDDDDSTTRTATGFATTSSR
jgi:hypothetical protein